ncbi:MAG: alpha/beta hydrolase [Rhodospirillaceae bacterium]|nr:alpha/beta hydrolase [Rhodospirillaceae bacterium]
MSVPANNPATALPIWATLRAVLGLCWVHRMVALRYASAPVGLLVLADIGGTLAGIDIMNANGWIAGVSAAALIVFAPLTVAWYRLVVFGPADIARRPLLVFGNAEWRLVGLNVKLALAILGMGAVGALVVFAGLAVIATNGSEQGAKVATVVLAVPVGVAVFYGLTRLSVALAYAAADTPITLCQAIVLTRGCAGRLTVLHALVALAAGILSAASSAMVDALGTALGYSAESATGGWALVVSSVATVFSIAYLLFATALFGLAYRRIERGEAGPPVVEIPNLPHVDVGGEVQRAIGYIDKLRSEGSKATIADFRALFDRFGGSFPLPEGARITPVDAGGVPAAWIDGPWSDQAAVRVPVVLYFHGGGFSVGGITSHRRAAADIGRDAGARVLLVDYRLAPEHPFPAAVRDCAAAYRWLIGQGVPAERIVFAGDSAGGNLVVTTMLEARAAGLPRPAAGVCLSPWVDLACTGATYDTNKAEDPIGSRQGLREAAAIYLAGADAGDPLASPIHGELSGLPPLLIQAGSREVLLDDARALGAAAGRAGVAVRLEIWPGMIHNWQMLADLLSDGVRANTRIGGYVRLHTDGLM